MSPCFDASRCLIKTDVMKTVQSVDLVVKLLLEYHRTLVARTRDCGPLRLGFIEDSEKERGLLAEIGF
jgi:hypothetical protein